MDIKLRKIRELVPAEYNPRRLTEKQFRDLEASFQNLGTLEPAVINTYPGRENVIISGHQRIKVAKKLGMKEYPCLEVSFPIEKEREANIRMNRNGGEWDFEVLANDFNVPDLIEWGFDPGELGINTDLTGTEGLTDPDAIPETPKEATTRPGDLYILGRHRLLCGDATNIQHAERLMDGKLADLIVTDPPYNVAYTEEQDEAYLKARKRRRDGAQIKNDHMSDGEFEVFLQSAYLSYFASSKAGAGIYVFLPDRMIVPFWTQAEKSGFLPKQLCIWVKDIMVLGRTDFHFKHEPVIYGWKEGAAHSWCSDRKQTTVWEFSRPTRSTDHPTMKPIDLISYPLECSSKPGELVIDFFGGSGSTLIACEKNARACFTMELDPKYCDVIIRRWEEFTGLKAELVTEETLTHGR